MLIRATRLVTCIFLGPFTVLRTFSPNLVQRGRRQLACTTLIESSLDASDRAPRLDPTIATEAPTSGLSLSLSATFPAYRRRIDDARNQEQ